MPKVFISTFTAAVLLFASGDIPGSERLRPVLEPAGTFSDGGFAGLSDGPNRADEQQGPTPPHKNNNSSTLQESSKLDLIRYVSGEFAKATRNLPAGKDGYLHNVGKPLNPEMLERAVATHGAAVHIGD